MKIILFFLLGAISSIATAQVITESVLVNTAYVVDSSGVTTFNVPFSRTTTQLSSDYHYRLVIKNADGEPHIIETCKDMSLADKAICKAANSVNKYYNQNYRVRKLNLSANSISLFNNSNFGADVASAEVSLTNITLSNNLSFTIWGQPGARIQLALLVDITNSDRTPPSIMSSIGSNTLNRNSTLHISITDTSATTTQVQLNGVLLPATSNKNFDITLIEGVNNIVVHSQDIAGNVSPNLILSNITLDTVAPSITTEAPDNAYLRLFPSSLHVVFRSSENLSLFKLNNSALLYSATAGGYELDVPILQAGTITLQFEATDLVGNAQPVPKL